MVRKIATLAVSTVVTLLIIVAIDYGIDVVSLGIKARNHVETCEQVIPRNRNCTIFATPDILE